MEFVFTNQKIHVIYQLCKISAILIISLFLFLVVLGFALAKQVLYCLSHTSNPFCSGYFEMRVYELFVQAGLEP
jgi:hypothetical protein